MGRGVSSNQPKVSLYQSELSLVVTWDANCLIFNDAKSYNLQTLQVMFLSLQLVMQSELCAHMLIMLLLAFCVCRCFITLCCKSQSSGLMMKIIKFVSKRVLRINFEIFSKIIISQNNFYSLNDTNHCNSGQKHCATGDGHEDIENG